jgi:hypothetical protein
MNAFGLEFHRITMSAELQVVAGGKPLTDVHHGLQTHSTGTEENNIISIDHDTKVGCPNTTAKLRGPQEQYQLVYIKTKENWRGPCTLPDSILYTKFEGFLSISLHITALLTVNE